LSNIQIVSLLGRYLYRRDEGQDGQVADEHSAVDALGQFGAAMGVGYGPTGR
jgi:hypothetical protein